MAKTNVDRKTVDLSGYPDLVVIYLGMRVNSPRGVPALLKIGPRIAAAANAKPDGLLYHHAFFFSLFPLHAGIRQYWRDFASLEKWARTLPHQQWWLDFMKNPRCTGFWHETYSLRGGMESIYDDIPERLGFTAFAPVIDAHGPMFSARNRLGLDGESGTPPLGDGKRDASVTEGPEN